MQYSFNYLQLSSHISQANVKNENNTYHIEETWTPSRPAKGFSILYSPSLRRCVCFPPYRSVCFSLQSPLPLTEWAELGYWAAKGGSSHALSLYLSLSHSLSPSVHNHTMSRSPVPVTLNKKLLLSAEKPAYAGKVSFDQQRTRFN